MLPGLAAWGVLMIKNGVSVGVNPHPPPPPPPPALHESMLKGFESLDTWLGGGLALNEGFIFTSMILATAKVAVIERKFIHAGLWCLAAALLSLLGFMHSYEFVPGDTVLRLFPPLSRWDTWRWPLGYAIMGLCFIAAKWVTRPTESGH